MSPNLTTTATSDTTSTSTDNEPLYLNVGGTPFATTRATLLSHPSSFLAKLLTFGSSPPSSQTTSSTSSSLSQNRGKSVEEALFIDADPEIFRVVLTYLRRGRLIVPSDLVVIEAVIAEADYFNLPGLVSLANALRPPPPPLPPMPPVTMIEETWILGKRPSEAEWKICGRSESFANDMFETVSEDGLRGLKSRVKAMLFLPQFNGVRKLPLVSAKSLAGVGDQRIHEIKPKHWPYMSTKADPWCGWDVVSVEMLAPDLREMWCKVLVKGCPRARCERT
ncbi:POZ domain-containing protein [Saitoella complicata NRRL Y-17804]|uniref:POZ domain-containing protein n=1 Tax=Saitoella complicata (strain BCRC 22490 / CBS 7301 / JCM 7358 / NBRC 10748 / NRRL Y-17804) TaxID=698492 RepID=UPI000866BDC8|nr:POZ domain-containing protein [Saitoella complicata NRRL Y-17804]ODQ50081.1 POZ domain-containing protein [Saitoella complicata NRRL Y-17804]